MKRTYTEMIIVGLFTALMGQVNFYPFGTDFRISIGVVVFTFLLLYFHSIQIVAASLVTGIMVLAVRIGIDVFAHSISLDAASFKHIPAFIYYVSYGIIIEVASFRKLFTKPIYFIMVLTTADIASNFFELIIRNQFSTKAFDAIFSTILLTAVIRSCLVFILFWVLKYYNLFITKEEHQQRYKELLMLTAKLKSEVLFLKKSMQDIESAMAKSYSIYNSIKERGTIGKEEMNDIVSDCLTLSIDIHEIKKDYNRIVISMEKLMPAGDGNKAMRLSEIFDTIRDVFTGYLEVTNKDIKLSFDIKENFSTGEYYILMSILGNMIQNSIEACYRSDSYIRIKSFTQGDMVVFTVKDNGKGVKPKDRDLIFEPGFTTKFNPETGQVSTGLGLTHIKILSDHLKGQVTLNNELEDTTEFRLEIPKEKLICEEDGHAQLYCN